MLTVSLQTDFRRIARSGGDYVVRWVCLAAVGITVMAGLRLLTIAVSVDPLISQLEWPALLLVFVLAYWRLAARLPHLAVPDCDSY